MLTVRAPAKLNLTLEVLAKRPDGFHEIRSVVQTIDLCDTLRLHPSKRVEFKCDQPVWTAEQSLISRAVSLLQKTTGYSGGVTVDIVKRIPLVSGLGGDSSGAAATLQGLNHLWGLGLSPEALLKLASPLGSDVAFFLYGGTALLRGKGEMVTPLPPLAHVWVVLMLPPVPRAHGKTERLYASLQSSHYTRGQITERLVALLTRGDGTMSSLPLFNVFEYVAFDCFAGLREYRQRFLKAGAREVHLAGSGPALFALVKDKTQAEKINESLKQQGLETHLTDTLAAIDKAE